MDNRSRAYSLLVTGRGETAIGNAIDISAKGGGSNPKKEASKPSNAHKGACDRVPREQWPGPGRELLVMDRGLESPGKCCLYITQHLPQLQRPKGLTGNGEGSVYHTLFARRFNPQDRISPAFGGVNRGGMHRL